MEQVKTDEYTCEGQLVLNTDLSSFRLLNQGNVDQEQRANLQSFKPLRPPLVNCSNPLRQQDVLQTLHGSCSWFISLIHPSAPNSRTFQR